MPIHMKGTAMIVRLAAINAIIPAVISVLLLGAAAQAQTEPLLYTFTGGSDGAYPESRLTSDGAGNF